MTPKEIREKELRSTPDSARGIVDRALHHTASPREAIKARCLQCLNFDRKGITNCQSFNCALWHYRPFQTPSKPRKR